MGKKQVALCGTCAAYRRPAIASTGGPPSGVPWLRSTAEVEKFKGLRRDVQGRHVVAADQLLAQYDFRGNGWRTPCSFPGNHRHAKGYIVQTICGLTVVIGHKCGQRWVDGLKDAADRAKVAEQYFASRQAMKRIVDDLPQILPNEQISEELLGLRHALSGALVHVARQLRSKDEARFSGLSLWRERQPDVPSLHRQFNALKGHLAALRDDALPREVTALQKRFSTLDQEVRDARRWFDSARPFASPANLGNILEQFGVQATVAPDGTITLPGKGDRPMLIGMGVYGLASPAKNERVRKA